MTCRQDAHVDVRKNWHGRGSGLWLWDGERLRFWDVRFQSGRLAGDFARWDVVGFLGGRMSGEPGFLVFDEVGGFFADVADGLDG
jgi:hypothetical protein